MRRKRQTRRARSSNKSNNHSKKVKEELLYRGIPCDSHEEEYFLMWAHELIEAGYIESIRRGQSYLLCGPMTNDYAKQLKTKSKPCSETLMQGHSYTPDFEIIWSTLGVYKFVNWEKGKKWNKLFVGHWIENERRVSTIEVKPVFDFNNMTRAFKINQKWMWDKFHIFINLAQPQDLFEKTFTPKEYLLTPTGKNREIKWKVRSLNQYLNND